MATETTTRFICDICKASETVSGLKPSQQWWQATLFIKLRDASIPVVSSYDVPKVGFLMCRECAERNGWMPQAVVPKEEIPAEPTSGERLVALIQEIANE